jgi:NADH:ubiquinone oxidoreductase subunit 4 (subunit M)
VFFGEFDERRFPNIRGITVRDKIALVLLTSVLIIVGIYPQILSNMVQAGMQPIVTLLAQR